MSYISLPDNCRGKTFDYLTKEDEERLRLISDLSLSDILNKDGSGKDSLIVFSGDINSLKEQYSDQTILRYKDGFLMSGNTMGFIGIGDTTIKIHSRFEKEDRDYFLHYLLQRVLQINLFDLPHSSSSEDIFDFLTMLFPYYLKKAMRQGMLRQYVSVRYNDSNFKGVLDVNRHIISNIPFNGKIAYNSRHFTSENPIFHLIKLTINRIQKKKIGYTILNSDKEIQECVREVSKVATLCNERLAGKIIAQNMKSRIHPFYYEYEPLRKLCLMILRNEEIKYGQEKENIYGILFDGAWLWEEYVAQILRGNFVHCYKSRGRRFYLFSENNKSFQQIIPDYISMDGAMIGDAKYIPLENGRSYDDERATAIYYKTITYMYRFNSRQGYLFFPYQGGTYQGNGPYVSRYNILSENPSEPNGSIIKLGLSIPLSGECEDFKKFKQRMKESEQSFLSWFQE